MDTRLGQMLILAGLVSPSQIEIALIDQQMSPHLRLGEILVLRGWLKPETIDYFVDMLPLMRQAPSRLRLGEYCVCANLLTEEQVELLLIEQDHTAIPLGQLAVRRGWLKTETVDFFLDTFGLRAHRPQSLASELAHTRIDGYLTQAQHSPRSTAAVEDLRDESEPETAESIQVWLNSRT